MGEGERDGRGRVEGWRERERGRVEGWRERERGRERKKEIITPKIDFLEFGSQQMLEELLMRSDYVGGGFERLLSLCLCLHVVWLLGCLVDL